VIPDAMTSSPLEEPEHDAPGRLVTRTSLLPFAAIAAAAELTEILPPGPRSPIDALISVTVLAGAAASLTVHSRRSTRWSGLISVLLYLASTLWLLLGSKDPWSIGVIVLVPVLWAALNLELVQSLVVVVAATITELAVTYAPTTLSWSDRSRREGAFLRP
jgi:hypothetical protein